MTKKTHFSWLDMDCVYKNINDIESREGLTLRLERSISSFSRISRVSLLNVKPTFVTDHFSFNIS